MISVWPRFVPGIASTIDQEERAGLSIFADGTPTNGLPYDRAGSDIDTTNPDAASGIGRRFATTF
jgi:alpha-D-xyloside xylohydrolase